MKDDERFNVNLGEGKEETDEMTVTLTLDDDTTLECVVINIFKAGDRELPQKKERFISTATARMRTESLIWRILKMTMNSNWYPMRSTRCWTPRSMMN